MFVEEWGTMVHAIFSPRDSCTTGTGAWIQLRVESVREEDEYEITSRLARTVLENEKLLVVHSIDEFIRQATEILEDPIAQYTSQPLLRLQQSLTRLEDDADVEEREDEDEDVEENVENDDSEFRIPLVSPCGEVSYRVQVQKGVHAALQVLMEMGLEVQIILATSIFDILIEQDLDFRELVGPSDHSVIVSRSLSAGLVESQPKPVRESEQ
ncbi:MAG: hypothetical protein NXY57DRAFT_1001691 [Lentinula lateritia]|nr:MAG: hypothetical protein NXY57DRAFT_1001691 [Lentinula lateritia]